VNVTSPPVVNSDGSVTLTADEPVSSWVVRLTTLVAEGRAELSHISPASTTFTHKTTPLSPGDYIITLTGPGGGGDQVSVTVTVP